MASILWEETMSMSDSIFIDSNVWLYAFVASDPEKHEISAGLITSTNQQIVISTQVLNQVSVNLLRKANVDEAFSRYFIKDAYSKYRIADIASATCVSASMLRETASLSSWVH